MCRKIAYWLVKRNHPLTLVVSSWHLLQTCGLNGTDCTLLIVFLYWIDKEWVMHEEMAGCVPFHGMRHTGENICKETEALMQSLDTTFLLECVTMVPI